MSEIIISVIIPAYNAGKQINKCLESIRIAIGQRDDIEILVINDGSVDDTLFIVQNFIDGYNLNIKLYSKNNGGVSSARNMGVEKATGKWIMFIDADDTVTENSFKVLSEYLCVLNAQEDTLLMYSHNLNFKNGITSFILPAKTTSLDEFLDDTHEHGTQILDSTLCTVWNKVYNHRILKHYDVRFPIGIKVGEDFIFNAQYLPHVKYIQFIPIVLYCYNNTDGSAIGKFYSDYDHYILSIDKAYSELLANLNIKSESAKEISIKFVADRWLYATWMCIVSSVGLRDKVAILQKWYRQIDNVTLARIADTPNNRYSAIANKYQSKISLYYLVIRLVFQQRIDALRNTIYKMRTRIKH